METQDVSKNKKMLFVFALVLVVFVCTWVNVGYAFQTLNILPRPQSAFTPIDQDLLVKMRLHSFFKKKDTFESKLEKLIQMNRLISISA